MVQLIGRKREEKDIRNPRDFISLSYQFKSEDGGIYRSYIPSYLYKPAIGYPRNINIPKIKTLGRSGYVSIVKDAIMSQVEAMGWELIPKQGYRFEDENNDGTPIKYATRDKVIDFLERPNGEGTFESEFVRKPVDDILDLDTGVLVKVFNQQNQLVAVQAREGGTFVKNPDIFGTYRDKADFMGSVNEVVAEKEVVNPLTQVGITTARDKASYFQYVQGGQMIIPFGRREVVWMIKNPKTYTLYGESPVMGINYILDYLLNSVRSDVEYFYKNNIPKGFISVEGGTPQDLYDFKHQFNNQIYETNALGETVRLNYKIPLLNKKAEFKNIEFSSQEMETLEKQKWYSKLVWAQFGVTSTELGFTEDAKGQANQIVQSKTGRKRAVLPICKVIEKAINNSILPELAEGLEFRFKTFDIDNEKSRVELRRQELEAGIKTINEVRVEEGLEPLEDGDRLYIDTERVEQNQNDPDNRDLDKENRNKENREKSMKTKKAKSNENQDAVKEGLEDNQSHEYDPSRLSKENMTSRLEKYSEWMANTLEGFLSQAENRIKELIEREVEQVRPIDNIEKSLRDLHRRASEILEDPPEEVENEVKEILNQIFELSEAEVTQKLGYPLKKNEDAQNFLEEYTFDLIKGMTDEVAGDLRQELQRGLMNGEATGDLKERVSSVFRTKEWRARAIANTETTRANNYGRLQAYNRTNEEIYKYISIVDDHRTTKVSYAMDRKYGDPQRAIPIRQEFSVWVDGKKYHGQAPPFMPNDRDTVIFITREEKEVQE